MPNQNIQRRPKMADDTRKRAIAEMASGQDDTNPQFLYATTATTLLMAITDGLIDPVGLARNEMVSRGLDQDGNWVGFPRAREIHFTDSTPARDDASSNAIAESTAAEVARRHLTIETLETRHSDSLDFHDCAVWSIREALIAAFESGARFTRDATNGQ